MTQLCTIPGCRIRGRHLGDCDDETCRGCQPRTAEGFVCEFHVLRAYEHLDEIRGLVADALLVAYGFVRHGAGAGGGKPGSRSPGNDDALDALDEVNNRLTTLVREIADAQRLSEPSGGSGVGSTIRTAAKWLQGRMAWLARATDDQGGPYAIAVFAEIRENASKIRGIVNGPADRKFYGICGSEIGWDDDGAEYERETPCDGDVYGRPDAEDAACRTCKARWKTRDRAAWLNGEVRDHAFRAAEIASAYGVNVNTIRTWHARGQLVEHGRDRDERPLFNVGEVLDLAAADAARRETERAKRERRAAARAAESEDAA